MFKLSQAIQCFPLLFVLLLLNSGNLMVFANGEEQTWCVAKPSSTDTELRANINYACDQVGKACMIIQEGGCCYNPATNINHASIAMNLYYQLMGRHTWNCNFRDSGLITLTNPSYLNCSYAHY